MNQCIYEIISNIALTKNVFEMKLFGDTSGFSSPGQFMNIKLSGLYLRRPVSICNIDNDVVTIIYKVVGNGTKNMSSMKSGERLDVLTGLGNGFNCSVSGENPVVIGGGVGVPPMYYLAKKLLAEGRRVTAILGFNTSDDVFYVDEFKNLGCEVFVSTADGSMGVHGFVTDVLNKLMSYSYVYTCGPEPMLKAVYDLSSSDGQFSFEERMGCGFGACMGCSCKTKYGNKRICKDGPVLVKEEIIW